MTEKLSLYAHRLDIGLGFRHVLTGSSCPNNNNNFFFESVSLCTTVISETVCLFSNVYIHSSSFIKNNFCENLPERIFCALAFELKREKKT